MTSLMDRRLAAIACIVVIGTLPSLFVHMLVGQPPYHCRYLVPVNTRPGIYACSEYPRAMAHAVERSKREGWKEIKP